MDQEETDDLTQRIISGDIDARDLDELVALLVSPETSAVMHTRSEEHTSELSH